MKCTGMRWTVAGANPRPVGALRRLGGWFDGYWTTACAGRRERHPAPLPKICRTPAILRSVAENKLKCWYVVECYPATVWQQSTKVVSTLGAGVLGPVGQRPVHHTHYADPGMMPAKYSRPAPAQARDQRLQSRRWTPTTGPAGHREAMDVLATER